MIKTVWCITLCVSNLEKSKRFYEEILGLEKKYEYSSYVGFECGGIEIGLIPKFFEERKKANLIGPSIEFLVNDVDKFHDRLKREGVTFIKELHEEPWGGRQATFTDLDGNILEIVQIEWEKYFNISARGAKKKT